MRVVLLACVAAAVLGLLAVSGRTGPPVPPPPGARVWSLSSKGGAWCELPILPTCTRDFGLEVLDLPTDGPVWGWTPPGDLRAAQRYGGQLIADVELRAWVPAAPASAWIGTEVAEAAAVAELAGGVTSHGVVPSPLRPVLAEFAARGCVGYPQVYDSDQSSEPRELLRRCVKSWQAAGFSSVVPVLGVSAGLPHLRAWLDECATLGLSAHLWSLERCKERGITCAELGTA